MLLRELSDYCSPENCRGNLRICIHFLLNTLEEDDDRQMIERKFFLQKFYVYFCQVFHATLRYSPSSNKSQIVEGAEETRLVLIQILSGDAIRIGWSLKNESFTSEDSRDGKALAHYKNATAAISLVY